MTKPALSPETELTPVDALAETWRALAMFAAELARQIGGMRRGGQRGFLKNVEILEGWLRAALLKMAEQIALPIRQRKVRRCEDDAKPASAVAAPSARRPGFRAIAPDAYETQMLALKRPAFDISQFSGRLGTRRDQRTRYIKRLAAITAALKTPELYARRVKRKLIARAKRPPMKFIAVNQRSALPDLKRLSPTSDLGRLLLYNDSG